MEEDKRYGVGGQFVHTDAKQTRALWVIGGIIVIALIILAYFIFASGAKPDSVPAATHASLATPPQSLALT